MKIHIASCETHATARRHHEQRLRELWTLSPGTHELVEEPAAADFIIIGNVRTERWCESLRRNPIAKRFPNRCYTVSEGDDWDIIPFLPGIYAAAHTRLPFQERYRSGSYELFPQAFQNSYLPQVKTLGYDSPKTLLASFTGRRSHPVRDRLLALEMPADRVLIRDTSQFDLFTHLMEGKAEQQAAFSQLLVSSKFALCPRGVGASSMRIFESMQLGVAPVIISDAWLIPRGPDWKSFAVFVKEREVSTLLATLEQHESRHAQMGRKARSAYDEFFAPEKYFDYVIAQLISIRQERTFAESHLWRCRNLNAAYGRLKHRARKLLRRGARRAGPG